MVDLIGLPYSIYLLLNIVVCDALFLIHMKHRPHFILRLLAGLCCVLPLLCTYSSVDSVWGSLYTFIGTLVLSLLMAKLCFEISWWDAAFCVVAGYTVQHIKSLVYWLFYEILNQAEGMVWIVFELIISVVVYGIAYLCFGRQVMTRQNINVQKRPLMALLILAIFVEIVLADMLRHHGSSHYDPVYFRLATFTNLLCSFCALIIQFNLIQKKSLEEQLEVISQMRRMEQQQYRISKDTINLINMKCHDMKHQIRSIGQSSRIDPGAIQEMEDVVGIYDAILKTGNQALDVILAEKSLFCQKNQIVVSCIADGKKLSFIE